MSGLGANAPWVQWRTTKPIPDRLNSQQKLTLRRLGRFEQVFSQMSKISKHAANITFDRLAQFALGRRADLALQAFRMY
jgi:hypothetical protein